MQTLTECTLPITFSHQSLRVHHTRSHGWVNLCACAWRETGLVSARPTMCEELLRWCIDRLPFPTSFLSFFSFFVLVFFPMPAYLLSPAPPPPPSHTQFNKKKNSSSSHRNNCAFPLLENYPTPTLILSFTYAFFSHYSSSIAKDRQKASIAL